ncbi:MAG: hypothetical protein WA123_02940 [Methylotenera sp.]
MDSNFHFPLIGWLLRGSNSYGSYELYKGIPHVAVKIFPESERILAQETYNFLKNNGLSTATLAEVKHTDEQLYFYVFSEKEEFLSISERLFPNVNLAA